MEILLSNNIAINLLVFICLPIMVLYHSRYTQWSTDFLKKSNTDILKGLSIIVVILSHIALFTKTGGLVHKVFINSGFLAVSIFLFVSGYGLIIQSSKKENYLKGFYKKVLYLYLVFVISNIVVTILNNLFLNTSYGIKDIIISSLKFKFANGRELWFVAIIIFMYINFYVAYKLFKGKTSLLVVLIGTALYIALCKIFGKGTWWYNTAICFTIGILFSIHKEKIEKFYKSKYWIKLIMVFFMFSISMILYTKKVTQLQYIIPIILIALITMILMKIELKSISMNFINRISFEMYLTHLIVLKILFKDSIPINSIYLVLAFPVMIILSIITQYIIKFIAKIIKIK